MCLFLTQSNIHITPNQASEWQNAFIRVTKALYCSCYQQTPVITQTNKHISHWFTSAHITQAFDWKVSMTKNHTGHNKQSSPPYLHINTPAYSPYSASKHKCKTCKTACKQFFSGLIHDKTWKSQIFQHFFQRRKAQIFQKKSQNNELWRVHMRKMGYAICFF